MTEVESENLDKAVNLIFNNKVNAKNAFEVDIGFIDNFTDVITKKQQKVITKNYTKDISWLKASAGLDASTKIYGYRVDTVHK